MQIPRGSARIRHVLAASLALVATMFAAGTPLLHALSHEHHAEHHAEHEAPAGEGHHADHDQAAWLALDHGDGEVHSQSLHGTCLCVRATPARFEFAAPALILLALRAPVVTEQPAAAFRTVAVLGSRAPPPGDPARAPPHV